MYMYIYIYLYSHPHVNIYVHITLINTLVYYFILIVSWPDIFNLPRLIFQVRNFTYEPAQARKNMGAQNGSSSLIEKQLKKFLFILYYLNRI